MRAGGRGVEGRELPGWGPGQGHGVGGRGRGPRAGARGRGVRVGITRPGRGAEGPGSRVARGRSGAWEGFVFLNNFVFPFPPGFVCWHVPACGGAENERAR